jgi:hypothetical protein
VGKGCVLEGRVAVDGRREWKKSFSGGGCVGGCLSGDLEQGTGWGGGRGEDVGILAELGTGGGRILSKYREREGEG